MFIDFYGSQVQFRHHLRPIYEALPEAIRGDFLNKPPATPRKLRRDRISVVSAVSDFNLLCKRRDTTTMRGHVVRHEPVSPLVLFEHGVGFSFHGTDSGGVDSKRPPSYAGGRGRGGAALLPATNRWVQAPNLKAYPSVPSPIVGCPKLDHLVRLPAPANERPKVCVSFHWDCRVAPETRWAFSWFAPEVAKLTDHPDFDLVMHGHPRSARFFKGWAKAAGIPFIDSFDEVCATCDVYVNDSSSTLYEFAALGRPVVVMNAPWYRRNVEHGLRFWEHSDVGLNANDPGDLLPAILDTLHSDPAAPARAAAIAEVYPYLGESCPRAVSMLVDLARSLET